MGAGLAGREERLSLPGASPARDEPAPDGARRHADPAAAPGIASAVLVFLIMLILFGPIVLLAVLWFDHETIIALDWTGFTTQWYRDAWANSDLRAAILNSLYVATIITAIGLVLGTMTRVRLTRFRFRCAAAWPVGRRPAAWCRGS